MLGADISYTRKGKVDRKKKILKYLACFAAGRLIFAYSRPYLSLRTKYCCENIYVN